MGLGRAIDEARAQHRERLPREPSDGLGLVHEGRARLVLHTTRGAAAGDRERAEPTEEPRLGWARSRREREGFGRVEANAGVGLEAHERDARALCLGGAAYREHRTAAHVLERGIRPVVLERGDGPAAHVRSWGHVRLFSPWRYCIDEAARRLLESTDWRAPDPDEHPTGHALVSDYLAPLAGVPAMREAVRYGASVSSVSRHGLDRMSSRGREQAPYRVVVQTAGGVEVLLTRAVIDASGTFASPNPLGADGVAVVGEREAAEHIEYGIPDVLTTDRARYAGRRVLVVGVGQPQRAGFAGLASDTARAPTLGAIAGHAMASVFHDTLQADVEQTNRVTRTMLELPREVAAHMPYKPISVLSIQPTQSLDALAQQHSHELPAITRKALGDAGGLAGSGAAMASYLLFEPGFVNALIALGEHDAQAREADIAAFFDDSRVAVQ
jgi:hypothetical protein